MESPHLYISFIRINRLRPKWDKSASKYGHDDDYGLPIASFVTITLW